MGYKNSLVVPIIIITRIKRLAVAVLKSHKTTNVKHQTATTIPLLLYALNTAKRRVMQR